MVPFCCQNMPSTQFLLSSKNPLRAAFLLCPLMAVWASWKNSGMIKNGVVCFMHSKQATLQNSDKNGQDWHKWKSLNYTTFDRIGQNKITPPSNKKPVYIYIQCQTVDMIWNGSSVWLSGNNYSVLHQDLSC